MDTPVAPPDDDQKSPWQFKSFSTSARVLAKQCADRADMSYQDWVAKAVRTQARIDEGNYVEPPTLKTRVERVIVDFEGLTQALQGAVLVEQASGKKMSARDAAGYYSLLRDKLREAKGLPPVQPRKPRGALVEHLQMKEISDDGDNS